MQSIAILYMWSPTLWLSERSDRQYEAGGVRAGLGPTSLAL